MAGVEPKSPNISSSIISFSHCIARILHSMKRLVRRRDTQNSRRMRLSISERPRTLFLPSLEPLLSESGPDKDTDYSELDTEITPSFNRISKKNKLLPYTMPDKSVSTQAAPAPDERAPTNKLRSSAESIRQTIKAGLRKPVVTKKQTVQSLA